MEKLQELSRTTKIALGILASVIALTLVLLVASNLALAMARQHDGEIHLFSIFSQLGSADPKHAKYAKIGLMAGVGLVIAAVVVMAQKFGVRALHGRARWSTESEIKEGGLRSNEGIICGKYRNKFLMFGGTEHVLVYAPTRSGKGIGVVIPNLLNWPDSCIVSDIKKENWALTAGFRRACGHEVYLVDPLDPEGRTARYNPLGYVDREDTAEMYDDLQRIAMMLFPPEGKDPFWSNAARGGFLAVAGYIAETSEPPLTMGEVLRQISKSNTQKFFKEVIDQRKTAGKPLTGICVTAMNDFTGNSENTFNSIRKSISAKLELWLNPRIDAATSVNDFDLRDLRRKPMSIYLGVTPDNLERMAPLLNLFFQQAVDLNTRVLPEHDKTLKRKVMLMMDEFAALGNVMTIVKGISYVAGYWLRVVTILQSPSQLNAVYGDDYAKTYLTNHAVEIVYTPKQREDANELSERFGYDTVTGTSRSKGIGFGAKGGGNETESDQRRALMLPQELVLTPFEVAYVIKGGIRPIKAEKIMYYKDAIFKERLLPAPAVAPISSSSILTQPAAPEPPDQAAQVSALVSSMLEAAIKPTEIESDSKVFEFPTDLNFLDVDLGLTEGEAAEAVEIKIEDWLDQLEQAA